MSDLPELWCGTCGAKCDVVYTDDLCRLRPGCECRWDVVGYTDGFLDANGVSADGLIPVHRGWEVSG